MNKYIIRFRPGSKILEIGGGKNPLRDQNGNRLTTNMDIMKDPLVNITHDLGGMFPWPVDDNSYDGIYGAYCLEHIPWKNIKTAVKEIYRVTKTNGKVIFFVPNTYNQCKKVVEKGISQGTTEMLFGSQEFPDHAGSHKCAFSPSYAKQLFEEAGFTQVKTVPHPVSDTDLIIEAYKIREDQVFEREYFEDGSIGYKNYRDFATHYATARAILQTGAKSVLDLGGARGYITKLLENEGITAVCMDISRHCWHNRATDSFILHDAIKTPWSRTKYPGVPAEIHENFKDKEFDLTFSINFLEHIPENKVDDVIREMTRVSKGGLHGIHFTESPYEEQDPDIDITHQTVKPESWWKNKFKQVAPEYTVVLKHPRMLEYEHPERQPPITIMPVITDTRVKLNLGSFLDMFYYGWWNLDIIDLHEFADAQKYRYKQRDLTKPLPYEDNSVDFIVSNHLIEHLSKDEGYFLLKECFRVMKKDAVIRISTPDTLLLSEEYVDGNIMNYKYMNIGVENADSEVEAYTNLLLAGHKYLYDKQSLDQMLKKAGFSLLPTVTPFTSNSDTIKKETLTTHPTVSVVSEAKK